MKNRNPCRTCYLVIYDVVCDGRRTRLSRQLIRYGERVQKSAFQLWLDDQELERIIGVTSELLDAEEDRAHFYPLCKRCREEARFVGQGRIVLPDGDVVV